MPAIAWRVLIVPDVLRQRMSDYLELTKPRLTALVLLTTAVGFWLGVQVPEQLVRLTPLLLGTACVAGGANALNQWKERALDARMQRTKDRPLPAGRLHPASAREFGWGLVSVGVVWLSLTVNGLSALLAAAAAGSYLFLYTPLKRITSLCTVIGAIPGAIPPMIGWAGARHALGIEAWALFALLFVWQLPHFLALAELFRDDYAQAGFQILSVVDPEHAVTAGEILLYGLVLVPVSLFPAFLGLTGAVYCYGALALSLAFLGLSARAARHHSLPMMRTLFLASIAYLSLLLVLLAADKMPRVVLEVSASRMEHQRMGPSLPDYGALPAFALINQDGAPVTRETLDGSVWIADFIFTRCAGQCPLMSAQMSQLQAALAGLPGTQLVSFTVDPAYDTPERLAAYATRYGAAPSRWQWLTGDADAVRRLAQQGFRLGVSDEGSAKEPITHSVRLVLVDRQAHIRGYYDATDPDAMVRLRADVTRLVR